MTNFNQLAAEFGGINGKLVKGKDIYEAKTVMDMVETIEKNISTTIEGLQSYNGQKGFKSPMARKGRSGIRVKVGYSSRNEKLFNDLEAVSFFENDLTKGIGCLQNVGSFIASCELNGVLESKL